MVLSLRIETRLSKGVLPLVKWARNCDWSGRGLFMGDGVNGVSQWRRPEGQL